MSELLSHKRALRRPAVVAAVSDETPSLVSAIHAAATSAADRAINSSSQLWSARKSGDTAAGGEVERLATALTRVKQAALRVETAEKAVAVFVNALADQAVGDAMEGVQGLRSQLKELEQVCQEAINSRCKSETAFCMLTRPEHVHESHAPLTRIINACRLWSCSSASRNR